MDATDIESDTIEDFLRKRGVSTAVLSSMADDKVDIDVVQLMTDDELKFYLPCRGDRIAVKNFVESKAGRSRKQDILSKLKRKMSQRRMSSVKGEKTEKRPLTAAERSVSFHWSHYQNINERYATVGRQDYGGIRNSVNVPKDWKKGQLIQKALSYYFEDGISTKGGQSEFTFELALDARGKKLMDNDESVEDVIKKKKIKNPRFYLLSKGIIGDSESELPDIRISGNSESVSIDARPLSKKDKKSDTDVKVDASTVPTDSSGILLSEFNSAANFESGYLGVNDPTVPTGASGILVSEINNASNFNSGFLGANDPTVPTDASGILVSEINNASNFNSGFLGTQQDTSDASNILPTHSPKGMTEIEIPLHRGHVLYELENYFMQNNRRSFEGTTVKVIMILPNGDVESGEDAGGILRDCLSEYWESFYDSRTVGKDLKVPALSVSVDEDRWRAIATIFVMGYYYEKYVPVKLAPSFLEYAMTGIVPSKEVLLPEYMNFLSTSEREPVKAACEKFDPNDCDDFLDFCDDHGVTTMPTKENASTIVADTAHKEMIQEPTFVADIWREQLVGLKPYLTTSLGDYSARIPTFKNVWSSVAFDPELSDRQRNQKRFLKRFLKEMSEDQLKSFLRFCTGADILLGKTIKVSFKSGNVSQFGRTPTAHTCGCLLEMPDSYGSYIELRNEFEKILTSRVWVMDIV